MKNLLVGNGINIQFDNESYTTQQIVLRALKNFERDDFPSHIIINYPYLMKNYFGKLYLEVREILKGNYDKYANCSAEKSSLSAFKEQYSSKLSTLRITDIGFEDYYLIHDLVCHKLGVVNPDQFYVREAMKTAYLFSIYNDGKLNLLHQNYSDSFKHYLNTFDNIFTTNYDSNIDSVVNKNVCHIHGHFEELSDVYNTNSFRNKLPDTPIKEIEVDSNYYYLYSTAITTHCGDYKEIELKQSSSANKTVTNLANAYLNDPKIKIEIDKWILDSNTITSNLGYAIQLKASHPDLSFTDHYHFERFRAIEGSLEILGLSPWNDFHIFEAINLSKIEGCIYYYYTKDQCSRIKELLPNLIRDNIIVFKDTKEFWRTHQ